MLITPSNFNFSKKMRKIGGTELIQKEITTKS
jgi:hypothetical protein